jgi:hypothetical protein
MRYFDMLALLMWRHVTRKRVNQLEQVRNFSHVADSPSFRILQAIG